MWDWAVKKKRTLGLERNVYVACEVLKRAWRDAHPATTALWSEVGDAVRLAIRIRRYTRWRRPCPARSAPGRYRLPSGRYLCYIKPDVDDSGRSPTGAEPAQHAPVGKIKPAGGKLSRNIVQAWARDVGAGAPHADRRGGRLRDHAQPRRADH